VLEFVNGKNSVRDIIALAKMGSFDVTKMLYRLLRNKLIRRRVSPLAV
jgi:DNA-binding MarR family transcriptional regulator